MSVEPGIVSAFGASLLDNGNVIDLPATSVWSWSTDDPTDVLVPNVDTSSVQVTVTNPPASGRTSITVTASTTDPAGAVQTGSVTTDLIPSVEHTYTVSVSQLFAAPKKR
jgi:hypothetical protein